MSLKIFWKNLSFQEEVLSLTGDGETNINELNNSNSYKLRNSLAAAMRDRN